MVFESLLEKVNGEQKKRAEDGVADENDKNLWKVTILQKRDTIMIYRLIGTNPTFKIF